MPQSEDSFDFGGDPPPGARTATGAGSDSGKTAGKGHRERLRERMLKGGAEALADYEVLEYLLFAAIKQGDTKPVAKALLERFGSLAGVLNADPAALQRVKGVGRTSAAALKAVGIASRRMTRSEITAKPLLGSWQALMDYCALTVRGPVERFHVLYLDRKNRIISDELLSTGTVDHVPVYPREVIKRALMLNASALILIHNHPSGDPTPSEADLSMTKEIQKGCKYLGLTLHDHIIVGAGTELSLRGLGKL